MRVFMFPGQSSCAPSILQRALALSPHGERVLAEAQQILDDDTLARFAGGVRPACNRDVQLSVFLANHLHLAALQAAGCTATWSLGLSLGEYNHLVHIEALSFADALRLVDARGRAYDRGPDGMMAAIAGVDEQTVRSVVHSAGGLVEISNFNGPSQHVIAGEREAVRAAMRLLEDEHYAMTVVIEERIPMHCDRFEPVATLFEPALLRAPWKTPALPYFPNVRGEPLEEPTSVDFAVALLAHVHRPVQWARSMDWIASNLPDATLVEVGPGNVLSNLARRGWPQLRRVSTDGTDHPRAHFEATVARL